MQFDAFERITQQQHRKLTSDFAWFYNIHWPQTNKNLQQKIFLSGAFERNFGPESREYERTNLPKFKCAGGVGVGEWWSLELIYAWVKLSICAERDSYTNGIFLWLLGENVKSGKDSENGFVTCLLWFIFFVVWIIVSKNKLNRCNAHCCLLRIHCLVSSRNAHSLLPLRDESEQKLRGRIL